MHDRPALAFIGAGAMAGSLVEGLVAKGWPCERITAACPSACSGQHALGKHGIRLTTDNHEAVEQADVVVLAVKPRLMQSVLSDLAGPLQTGRPLLVSVAAGITLASLDRWAGGGMAAVRAMPNTPSCLQMGATGLYANARVTAAQKETAQQIMEAVGLSLWCEEEQAIDAVTAVSGSGPAYFFLVMEAMIAAGEQLGLPRSQARQLVVQTARGAAGMAEVHAQERDIAQLRRQVTSPGGTTEQAICAFEAGGLEALVAGAMTACRDRARAIAEQFADD